MVITIEERKRYILTAGTDECDWNEVLSEIDDLLDQLVASEEGPW